MFSVSFHSIFIRISQYFFAFCNNCNRNASVHAIASMRTIKVSSSMFNYTQTLTKQMNGKFIGRTKRIGFQCFYENANILYEIYKLICSVNSLIDMFFSHLFLYHFVTAAEQWEWEKWPTVQRTLKNHRVHFGDFVGWFYELYHCKFGAKLWWKWWTPDGFVELQCCCALRHGSTPLPHHHEMYLNLCDVT